MHIDKPSPPRPKISRNDYRKMINKEKMLNGKEFQSCSRWELFEMIMAMSMAIATLNKKISEMESLQAIPDEIQSEIVEVMETIESNDN